MRILVAAAMTVMAFSGVALAAEVDPLTPVNVVMGIVQKDMALSGDAAETDYVDYLSGDILHQNFSAAFVDVMEKGEKKSDSNDEPFIDYEPVVGGQDSCPIDDTSVKIAGQKDGAYDVVARFKAMECFGDGYKDKYTETHFRVIVENGKPVIDDITNMSPDSDPISLRDVMKSYVEQ